MPQQVQITVPTSLTSEHLRVVLKYFEATSRLSPSEWKAALEAFDGLGGATVNADGRQRTFRQIYDAFVNGVFADDFLTQLVASADALKLDSLQRETSRAILAKLEHEGFYSDDVNQSEFLAAYCLYWWTAFVRGYRFEWAVLQDLEESGVEFHAHDLTIREERLSPYDLVVSGQLGDIKNTTYFLHTARTRPLSSDFYITQLFDSRRRKYVRIVLMPERAWHALNGPAAAATLETAAEHLPQPVQFNFDETSFVVLPYELWKEKVIFKQQGERNE